MANKFLSALVTVAAIGGVCYAFKDKIKESKVYQSLEVEDKVQKVKTTIKEKMPTKDESDRDYFTLNEEDVVSEDAEATEDTEAVTSEDAEVLEESIATDVSESASDVSAMVDDLLSDIPEIQIAEENTDKQEDSPILYENEGLSDASDDLEVAEEQDKLDI